MNRKTIMAMPAVCFCGVVAVCIIGLILGGVVTTGSATAAVTYLL